jgi:metal-responsive CopG/Arc/MetJ family transcriptional regulator
MFDGIVDYISDPEHAVQAESVDSIIQSSDVLRAGYLERMQRAQAGIVAIVVEGTGERIDELAAAVGAALSALSTAHQHTARSGMPLADALDTAMGAVPAFS